MDLLTRPSHTVRGRAVAVLAATSLAFATLAGCASETPAGESGAEAPASAEATTATEEGTVFRVAYLSTANYLTTVVDDGFLDEELAKIGAKAEYLGPSGPFDAYTEVTSGNADASSTGTGYFINLLAEGSPWVAFALERYDGTSQGIVAAPGTGAEKLEDLYGKKIGIDGEGATGDYIVNTAFAAAGLDVSKVEKVVIDPANFAAAFSSGQIDALASFDQNLANAIAQPGAKLLVNGSEYGSLNFSMHMASKEFAEQHPDALKAAYVALRREAAKAKENPSIITDTYTRFGASDETVEVVKSFYVPDILPFDDKAVAELEQQAQQYVDYGFIDAIPDIKAGVLDFTGADGS
jgi:sulfonate transport system substrate-binding protein